MSAFTVKQEKFEGPLEVLLDLIEKKKLHINDVTLSKVTDDFLAYAKGGEGFPLAECAQFAYIAATLLLIKSKSLLPNLSLTTEEETSIEDLERRLALLKRFRELSRHLRERTGIQPLFLPLERKIEPTFAPPKNLGVPLLLAALKSVLAALPKTDKLSKNVIQKALSLEEMIINLTGRIAAALRMSFRDFAGPHKDDRVTVIVGFLAMLELVKQGIIAVTQERSFGEIVMETESIETPRY